MFTSIGQFFSMVMISCLLIISFISMLKQRNFLLGYFFVMEILLLFLGIYFVTTQGYDNYLPLFGMYAFLAIYLRLRK